MAGPFLLAGTKSGTVTGGRNWPPARAFQILPSALRACSAELSCARVRGAAAPAPCSVLPAPGQRGAGEPGSQGGGPWQSPSGSTRQARAKRTAVGLSGSGSHTQAVAP